MGACFWTDMGDCVEECGGETPPQGALNLLTWYLLGSCTTPNDGSVDSFGDVAFLSSPAAGELGPSAHPWSVPLPCVATVHGSAPGCLATMCPGAHAASPILGIGVFFQPPPGGEAGLGWTFKGAFNISPFVVTGLLLDGTGATLQTLTQYGNALASDSGALWHVGMQLPRPTAHATATTLAISLDWTSTPPGSGLNLVVDHIEISVSYMCPS